jgi:hypothetical protein
VARREMGSTARSQFSAPTATLMTVTRRKAMRPPATPRTVVYETAGDMAETAGEMQPSELTKITFQCSTSPSQDFKSRLAEMAAL